MQRDAFSMVELVFVIVVLGIVASLGSDMIANAYKGYILQRAQHRASIKTELAALQIANRFSAVVSSDTFVRKDAKDSSLGGSGTVEFVTGTNGMKLDPKAYTVIQWIGADMESFNAIGSSSDRLPGWSGFIDIDESNATTLVSKGSKLSRARTIITNLNGGTFPSSYEPAIFFPYDSTPHTIKDLGDNDTNITLSTPAAKIVEHYKLAWSSYALVIENGNLYLYYGFKPQIGIAIPADAKRSLLLRHITEFKFQGRGGVIRFKICKSEAISPDSNITACKEKAVF